MLKNLSTNRKQNRMLSYYVLCLFLTAILSIQNLHGQNSGDVQEIKVPEKTEIEFKSKIDKQLKRFGHRNWIVIADSAYPLQSAKGINTITTDMDYIKVISLILKGIDVEGHNSL